MCSNLLEMSSFVDIFFVQLGLFAFYGLLLYRERWSYTLMAVLSSCAIHLGRYIARLTQLLTKGERKSYRQLCMLHVGSSKCTW
jgi:hypothetical protein